MILFGANSVMLRPLALNDAEMTLRWRLSERAKYLHPGAQTVDEQRAWIASHVKRVNEVNFIIEWSGLSVGMISLIDVDYENGTAELARELIVEKAPVTTVFIVEKILLDYAFDNLHLRQVVGRMLADNDHMVRTRRHLGWHEDGRLREWMPIDGHFSDMLLFSLLRDEYRTVGRAKLEAMLF